MKITSNYENLSGVPYENEKIAIEQENINDTTTKYDSFEKSEATSDNCETYTDWSFVEVRCTTSALGNSLGDMICSDSYQCMRKYYSGVYSKEQVYQCFQDSCNTMFEYWNATTPEGTVSADFKAEIVQSIYRNYCYYNTVGAVQQCEAEGDVFNAQYSNCDNDFSYYSSDIYYQWKEMAEELFEVANETGSSLSGKKCSYDAIYEKKAFQFNDMWNNRFCTNGHVSKVIDTSMEPPENFSFFYKASPYYYNENADIQILGQLIMTTDKGQYKIDVPFQVTYAGGGLLGPDGMDGQIFHINTLLDIFDIGESEKNYEYLKNFLVFTEGYGHYYHMT